MKTRKPDRRANKPAPEPAFLTPPAPMRLIDWTKLRSLSELLAALNVLGFRVQEGTPAYEQLKHLVAE